MSHLEMSHGKRPTDFFISKYGGEEIVALQRIRFNFIWSMATYSAACWIPQIKDRHNGNIMIDGEGYILFHPPIQTSTTVFISVSLRSRYATLRSTNDPGRNGYSHLCTMHFQFRNLHGLLSTLGPNITVSKLIHVTIHLADFAAGLNPARYGTCAISTRYLARPFTSINASLIAMSIDDPWPSETVLAGLSTCSVCI